MKKRWFVSLLACILTICFMSVTAFAAETTYVAEVNGTQYESLQDALDEAKDGDKIVLLEDVETDYCLTVSASVTIDMNRKTLTGTDWAFMNSGDVDVTVKNGTIDCLCGFYWKEGSLTLTDVGLTTRSVSIGNYDASTVTVGAGTTVTSTDYVAIVTWGDAENEKTPTLNVYGTVKAADYQAISTNGTDYSNPVINVYDGAEIASENSTGMYIPVCGSVNISGGTITGSSSAIGIKEGKLNISGGTLIATGPDETPTEGYSNGINASGAAIQIESNDAYKENASTAGTVTVNITGGEIISENGYAIYEYLDSKTSQTHVAALNISAGTVSGGKGSLLVSEEAAATEEAVISVSGGTFSGDISAYLAEDADNVAYNTVLKAPTCTANGIGKLIQTVDGKTSASYYVILAEHKAANAVVENDVAATCTGSGSYDSVVYCSVCGEELSRETVTVEAKGHTAGEVVTTVPATCAESGSRTYTCTVCGEEITEEIPATGQHTWKAHEYTRATCTENGKAGGQICSVCGAENPDNAPEDLGAVDLATGHTWVLDVTAAGYKPATCVEEGVGTYQCSECSATKTEAIPATGKHTEKVVEAKAPTCGKAGHTEGLQCSVCHKVLYGMEEIEATGAHTEEVVPGRAATCKDTGLTDGKKCSVCGKTLAEQEVIPVDPEAHTYKVEVLKEATCTANGVGKYVCKDCGASKYATIPADHSWNEGEVTKAATCTDAGVMTYTCMSCDATKTGEIPALGHTWGEGAVTTEATCGKNGVRTYTCTVCDATKTEEIPATGKHNYKENVIEATCTEPAMVGEICSVCGHAKSALTPVGDPAGHKYVESVTKAATCVEAGEKTYTCSVCGDSYTEVIPATGVHTDTVVAAKAPTCVEDGYNEGVKCGVCGKVLYGCEVIPATGEHTIVVDAAVPATCGSTGLTEGSHCSVCNKVIAAQEVIPVNPDAHNYALASTLKPKTCTTTGIGKYVCSICGDYYYATIEAGHTWDDGKVTTEATCGKAGEMTYTCTVEGCGATKTEVIPATGKHNYGEDVVEATCTSNAKVGFVCTVCGAEDPDRETVEVPDTKIAHNYEVVVVAATCTKAGEATYTCSVCGDSYTEVIPATGVHTDTVVAAKAPTCVEDGNTEGVKCSVCGEVLFGCEVIPATGEHTEEVVQGKAATCKEAGLTEGKKCSVCGEILTAQEEIPVDPDAHQYEVTPLKEATCSATGIGKYVCAVCGDSYYGVIETLPHSFDEAGVKITAQPTCTEPGVLTVPCSKCGATEERTLAALGHNWSDDKASDDGTYVYRECSVCHETEIIAWLACEHANTEIQNAAEATCTTAGYTGDTVCADCGATVEAGEVIPALGHTEEVIPGTPANCTEAGLTEGKKCSVCGETLVEQEEIPAAGHTLVDDAAVAPTCTEAGKEAGKHCENCDYTEGGAAIPAAGHTAAEAVKEKEVPATETEDGSYESVVYCSVCGAEISRETVVIPATGPAVCEHKSTKVVNAREATCTEAGYTGDTVCADCGEVLQSGEEIPALSHYYVGVFNEDGTITYTCKYCGDSFTV